jgi:LuxR family maltose regulon positive regulatory protein
VLAPVLDGSAPLQNAHLWEVQAFLLQAIACDALGDAAAARGALERALDRAEPERLHFPFLYDPAPDLLDRHRRTGTAHAALIAQILNVLAGSKPGTQPAGPPRLREPLSHAEARILRYLPTKLSACTAVTRRWNRLAPSGCWHASRSRRTPITPNPITRAGDAGSPYRARG